MKYLFLFLPVLCFGQDSLKFSKGFRMERLVFMSDSARISFGMDGRVDVQKGFTDKVSGDSSSFNISMFTTIATFSFMDPSGIIGKELDRYFKERSKERIELESKIMIYEQYYGKIKGKPYSPGDCIEMEPPTQKRIPCYEAPNKKTQKTKVGKSKLPRMSPTKTL